MKNTPHIIEIDVLAAYMAIGIDLRLAPLAEECVAALRDHLNSCITQQMLVAALAEAAGTKKRRRRTTAKSRTGGQADESCKQLQSPPLRSKKGDRREFTIQIRVSEKERARANANFGKSQSKAVRAFLCGYPEVEPPGLNNEKKLELFQALHAVWLVDERMYHLAELGYTADVKELRKIQTKTFKHLAMLCYSSFSK